MDQAERDRLLVRLEARAEHLEKMVEEIKSKYTTVEAFTPVRAIAYGLAALILTAVVSAVIASVLISRAAA